MKTIKYEIGNNKVVQIQYGSEATLLDVDTIISSWKNAVSFYVQDGNSPGFRPAQLGALFSIKSHWIVSNEPATVVMPTGTGKTETMIATVVSEMIGRTLIVVPSN